MTETSRAQLEELLTEYERVVQDLLRWIENDKKALHAVVVEARARGVLEQHALLKKQQRPPKGPRRSQSTNQLEGG